MCTMYSDFQDEDAASPTVSSSDVVEWTEYSNVDLWFERYNDEGKISVDLSQALRDVCWFTWVKVARLAHYHIHCTYLAYVLIQMLVQVPDALVVCIRHGF